MQSAQSQPKRRRRTLRWIAIFSAVVMSYCLLQVWATIEEDTKFIKAIERAESVVVKVPIPTDSFRVRYYRLTGNDKDEFLSLVRSSTHVSFARTWATAYVIRVYLCNNRELCYAAVPIQPAFERQTYSQMKALAEAAAVGEQIDRDAAPVLRSELVILRTCAK